MNNEEVRRSANRRNPKAVRVWAEVGATLCIDPDNRQFIRFTFGHEKIAPNDEPETLRETEQEVYAFCNEVAEQRLSELAALARQVSGLPEPVSARPSRSKTKKARTSS